jgi:hypothetical protein
MMTICYIFVLMRYRMICDGIYRYAAEACGEAVKILFQKG